MVIMARIMLGLIVSQTETFGLVQTGNYCNQFIENYFHYLHIFKLDEPRGTISPAGNAAGRNIFLCIKIILDSQGRDIKKSLKSVQPFKRSFVTTHVQKICTYKDTS